MKLSINQILINESAAAKRRARIDFGDIERLAMSIKEFGLMHPVVVQELETPVDGKTHVLVAGERRIRACLMLGMNEIQATLFEGLTDLRRKTMELEENLRRKNLDWPEEDMCIKQIHELKQIEYGTPVGDPTGKKTGWGVRDTASLLNRSIGSVSNDIQMAKVLEERPDLLKQVRNKPKVVANKIVKRVLENERLELLVKSKGIDIGVDLREGSCVDLIKTLDDNSIDCLLTDPPFASPGIVNSGSAHRKTYNLTKSNVSNLDYMLPLYDKLLPELSKKLRVGAHIYIFCGMGEHYMYLYKNLSRYGFLVDELPLIWYKGRSTVVAKDYSYLSSYEPIIFGHYGKKKLGLLKPVKNVLSVDPIHPSKRVHPLQRPDELLRILINNSTLPGQTILDCFAGSGSTLKVARDLQRKAIGFELDHGNYMRAMSWLQATAPQT